MRSSKGVMPWEGHLCVLAGNLTPAPSLVLTVSGPTREDRAGYRGAATAVGGARFARIRSNSRQVSQMMNMSKAVSSASPAEGA